MNNEKKSQELLSQTLQNLRRRNPSSHKSSDARNCIADTKMSNGRIEKPPVTVYDTSGPFTTQISKLTFERIATYSRTMDLDRNDVEELTEISSEYGKKRLNDELNELRLNIYTNQCMPKGANVSQLYYAKQGIITPEMEYIAIRENQRLELINEQTKAMQCQHEGNSWVQTLLSFSGRSGWGKITPEFVRSRSCQRPCHYSK
jgi:phosphomethylpyrimidine synthase